MRTLIFALTFIVGMYCVPAARAQQATRHALYFDPVIDANTADEVYGALPANSLGRVVSDNLGGSLRKVLQDFPRSYTPAVPADLTTYVYPWRESWVQFNNGKANGSDWVLVEAANSYTLTFGKTDERLIFPVSGLRAGDGIVGMRAIGAYAGAATTHTLTVQLASITPAASATVEQTVTYTLAAADTSIADNAVLFFAEEFFTAGTPLYVSLVGTTAATTPTITIVGVELLIRQC